MSDSMPGGFYITGGTLQNDARSYVRRAADDELYARLAEGEFCYVLTARQMGKSSLMVRTASELRRQGASVAALDLTALGQNLSVEQWYYGLLEQVGHSLDLEDDLEDFWLAHPEKGPLQRWMSALRDIALPHVMNAPNGKSAPLAGRLILFVDEIDVVQSLPFSTDEFFAAIRECYNRRTIDPTLANLSFCLLGVATPSDLIRDVRMTPFNIGRRIELLDFTASEAAALIEGLGTSQPGRDARQAAALLQRVLYWTGGHPYLTQRLCQAVAADESVKDAAGVDRVCRELFLSSRSRERDDNLLFVRDRLLRSEEDRAGLLDLYATVRRRPGSVRDDESNPLISVLRLSGIVSVTRGALHVRNRIYHQVFDEEWITANMPTAELRRQRAAYHRGLLRASAIAAIIIAAMGALAGLAYVNGQAAHKNLIRATAAVQDARHETSSFRHLLYIADMNVIQQAWESTPIQVGRVLELLEETRTKTPELCGFEWGYWWRLCHQDLMTLKDNGGPVGSVAFSPDGKLLASGSYDTIKIRDAQSGRVTSILKGHTLAVTSVAFSPDGKRLASGNWDKTVRIWDVQTGREIHAFKGHTLGVTSVAFSPDGKRLASGSLDKTVRIWNAQTGRETRTLQGHTEPVRSVAFSPDGTRLASGSYDIIKIWDTQTGRVIHTLKGHAGSVLSMAFSPDGKQLASGMVDGTVKIWDAQTGRATLTPKGHTGPVYTVAFSPDGKQLASGSADNTIKIWDMQTGLAIRTLEGHTEAVLSVAFSPDGKRLASGGLDKTIRIWDAQTDRETLTLKGNTKPVRCVAFSPDAKRLASGSLDNTIRIWDAQTGRVMLNLKGHTKPVASVAFSPDGKRLASGSLDNTTRIWDAQTGRGILNLKGHNGPVTIVAYSPDGKRLRPSALRKVTCVAFSPDGKRLASGGYDNTINIWDAQTGRETYTLKGHTEPINSVAFSPDGKRLASGSNDNTVRIWDTQTGLAIRILNGHAGFVFSVAFSPDGKQLASGNYDGAVKIWDMQTGWELHTLGGYGEPVGSVAFSPDGKRLASGSWDNTIKIWDVQTGRETLTLKGHTDTVWSVAFSPDGKRLASGSYDSTVKIWYGGTPEDIEVGRRTEDGGQ